MAYTLTNLQDDIRNYTEVDSGVLSTGVLNTIIKNAENRIYRESDSDDNRFYATSNLVTGSRYVTCLLYTSPSPRDRTRSRMPSSA